MKKFMFSAVALIALSFASMANTGGEEKFEVKEENNKIVIWNECDQLAEDIWNAYKSSGSSDEEAYEESSKAYTKCISRPTAPTQEF